MTAIASSRPRATPFERLLLDLAGALEHVATTRAERRRALSVHSAALHARIAAQDARTDARALGGLGVLPR
ncbi:MAG: hypothetical protein ABW024_06270 [Microbacterium sp.]